MPGQPRPIRSAILWIAGVVVFLAVVFAIASVMVLPGLSVARHKPPAIETDVATWLLHHSVPASAKARINPVAASAADIEAGHSLFQQKCEVCHAYDGGGKTEIGAGAYPHPPAL